MSRKRWDVAKTDRETAKFLAQECGIDPFLALILASRGLRDPYEIDEFLDEDQQLSDPCALIDMDRAATRLNAAVDAYERIAVYGDYDADGVTSTAMLYDYLSERGADVLYIIPEREDGYGMNRGAIDDLKARGVSLIITVDNGVTAVEEVAYAASLGIDVVVTDHHLPQERLPQAVAVVDPHRADCPSAFKSYAGVGVAFLLLCAAEGCACEEMLERYGDLVAIGTIADVMPLTGENRLLVRRGLRRLPGQRPGLRALAECAGGLADGQVRAQDVAFRIAPRLNAAGRMGLSSRAVRLLTEPDKEQAEALARELNDDSVERQRVERQIVAQAEELIRVAKMEYDRVIVVAGEGWRHGVIGLAASRLCEKYGRPCVVISTENGATVGSARSVAGFSIHAALGSCAELLTRFGGHELAAGFSIDPANIESLRRRVNACAAAAEMPFPVLKIDCRLSPRAFTPALVHALAPLAPCGSGNPAPVFGMFGVTLERVASVGDGRHLRLTVSRDGASATVMKFSTALDEFGYRAGDVLDLAVGAEASEYRGAEQVTLTVRGVRAHGCDEEALLSDMRRYERVRRGEPLTEEESPRAELTREDVARAFRAVRAQGFGGDAEALCLHAGGMGYLKLRLALDVLAELSLLDVSDDALTLRVRPRRAAEKLDLEQSALYRRVKARIPE